MVFSVGTVPTVAAFESVLISMASVRFSIAVVRIWFTRERRAAISPADDGLVNAPMAASVIAVGSALVMVSTVTPLSAALRASNRARFSIAVVRSWFTSVRVLPISVADGGSVNAPSAPAETAVGSAVVTFKPSFTAVAIAAKSSAMSRVTSAAVARPPLDESSSAPASMKSLGMTAMPMRARPQMAMNAAKSPIGAVPIVASNPSMIIFLWFAGGRSRDRFEDSLFADPDDEAFGGVGETERHLCELVALGARRIRVQLAVHLDDGGIGELVAAQRAVGPLREKEQLESGLRLPVADVIIDGEDDEIEVFLENMLVIGHLFALVLELPFRAEVRGAISPN